MDFTRSEVAQFVSENDVKFIRLAFCDVFGMPKNVSINAGELSRAFETGIAFDAAAVGIEGFKGIELYLCPDPATVAVLPWRPQQGRVVRLYCDIKHPDGEPFAGDGRNLVRRSMAADAVYTLLIGTECDFYLFEADEAGNPTDTPHDRAGYLDMAPLDRGENVRREVCLTLEQMDIQPEYSHHERGPGQNRIIYRQGDLLAAADDLITFRSVVKTVAAHNGLHASFLPKPIAAACASGMGITLTLQSNDIRLYPGGQDAYTRQAESFAAGILAHMSEMTAFLNPLPNSYARLNDGASPVQLGWSGRRGDRVFHIPAQRREDARMTLISPDPTLNPYLAFSLLMAAGMQGVREGAALCPPEEGGQRLPETLGQAVAFARTSAWIGETLPQIILDAYLDAKEAQWAEYEKAQDRQAFDKDQYFAWT